uniref:Uncharacterized protein n=1 Tax=viral metagenome TaxID=1070528 RepID=A0A6C0D5H1_9ZZZZ
MSFRRDLQRFNDNPQRDFTYGSNPSAETPKRQKTLNEVVQSKATRAKANRLREQDRAALEEIKRLEDEEYRRKHEEALKALEASKDKKGSKGSKSKKNSKNKGISSKEVKKLLEGKSAALGGKRHSRKTRKYRK